jgi:hypothetical protein
MAATEHVEGQIAVAVVIAVEEPPLLLAVQRIVRRIEIENDLLGGALMRDAADGAVEEVARLVARIRARWPHTRIMLRADSGFARDDLMAWCEANDVDFVFGLARNERLVEAIASELDRAVAKSRRTGRPERRFKSFMWMTRSTWSGRRRVVAKAEALLLFAPLRVLWPPSAGRHAAAG